MALGGLVVPGYWSKGTVLSVSCMGTVLPSSGTALGIAQQARLLLQPDYQTPGVDKTTLGIVTPVVSCFFQPSINLCRDLRRDAASSQGLGGLGCARGLDVGGLDNFAHLRPIVGELLDSFQDWIFAFLCLKAGKLGLARSPELV